MGVIRFIFHPEQLTDGVSNLYRAYLSGFDNRVFPTRVEIDGNLMTCRRQTSESGKLHVSWPIPGFGRPLTSTSSLREREEPYLLLVELARGKIGALRDQLSMWEISGMAIPPQFNAPFREAHRLFGQAVGLQGQPDQADSFALQSLQQAFRASEILTSAYTEQRLTARRQRSNRLPASLGCVLGHEPLPEKVREPFCQAFNAAAIPIEWRWVEPQEGDYHWDCCDEAIQWCEANRLLAYAGPLIDLSVGGMPAWLAQWEHDYLNLQSFVCDYVETAITRFQGRIRLWEVSARANSGGALRLNEEKRLTLAARTLEVARHVDEEAQLMVRIDQPWGAYQARGQHLLSPIQFADALIRSGVGLSGITLEIGIGYRPVGTASRDRIEFSRLIDLWSTLGVPLFVHLAFPSSAEADSRADGDLEVEEPAWKSPWSNQAQAEWIDAHLPLLMSKPNIVGIYWTHFCDQLAHTYPNAGLVDAGGNVKPALNHIINYHHAYWR